MNLQPLLPTLVPVSQTTAPHLLPVYDMTLAQATRGVKSRLQRKNKTYLFMEVGFFLIANYQDKYLGFSELTDNSMGGIPDCPANYHMN